MTLVNDALDVTNERADAQKIIEEYIAGFDHHDYESKQGTWWCRNDGDEVVKTLVIRPEEPK